MNSSELLSELLALFTERIPEAVFCRAFSGQKGGRLPKEPVVTGEVENETVKPASSETRLCFRIFLPPGTGARRAEELFARMCQECGARYPAFSAIARGPAQRDSVTGLLVVACALTFLESSGGGVREEQALILGGREYRASGVSTSIRRSGESLVSIGETEPFAVLGEKTEYTVELSGIETSGLSDMAVFTAVIGQPPNETAYKGCRWKVISDALRKATFVSYSKE